LGVSEEAGEAGEALRAWLMSAEEMSLTQRFVVGTKATVIVERATVELSDQRYDAIGGSTCRRSLEAHENRDPDGVSACRRTVLGPQ
jgi:hypothetical protein